MAKKPTTQAGDPVLIDLDRHLDAVTYAFVEDCISANAALQSKYGSGRQATLPKVRHNPPEVEYRGRVFQVGPDHALAFQAMVEHHPERVGLTPVIGPHPERKMARLPAELKAIVDTSGKGSRIILS